jgi:putative ABC transport system permease protein
VRFRDRGRTSRCAAISDTISPRSEIYRTPLIRERLLATMAGVFGALALLLAAIGLYGLMSYDVARRTREIGVRMALGAARREVLGMVLRESLAIVVAGALIGSAVAWMAARLMGSLLFGLKPQDPPTVLISVAVLLSAALAAALLPALRAARIDPITALREE